MRGCGSHLASRVTPRFAETFAAACGLVVALASEPASAQPAAAATSVALGYSAVPGCPSRAEFESELQRRVSDLTLTGAAETPLAIEVELSGTGDAFAGVLWVRLPDGTRSRRDAAGAACAEVSETLAVIAALAIEGFRTPAEPATTQPSAAPSPEGPPPPAEKPEPPPSSRAAAAASALASPAPSRRPSFGAYASGVAESAVAPELAWGATAGVELEGPKSGAWWPSARLGFVMTVPRSATETTGQASADFQLFTARIAVCPWALGGPKAFAAHFCAEFDGGALRAESGTADNAGPQVMPWLAGGPGVRADLPLTSWLDLEAGFAVRLLVRQDTFVFDFTSASGGPSARPPSLAHEVPPVSFGLNAGLSARIF